MTGFNPEEVNQTLSGINAAYSELIRAIGTDMQSKFVGGMAQKWACNQAIEFFRDAFQPTCETLISDTNVIFQSVVDSVNSAASSWAASTGTTYNNSSFTPNNFKYDISVVRENIGGVRGIDKAEAQSVVNGLQSIKAAADTALAKAKTAVTSHSAFIGDGQAETLSQALDKIKNNVNNALTEVVAAVDKAIQATIASYEDTAGRVSQAFNG